jgi:hypothetical protein
VPWCDNGSHVNSQSLGQLYRVYYPATILAKAPSNRRTRLCSSAAPNAQAHQQSSDSYYWELEHADATGNSKTPRMIQLRRDVSTTEKRTTMLMCAPNCDHTPIGCRQPTHLPIEVPTLFSWLLSRTLLEEESTKWLFRMPQWMLYSSSTHSIMIISWSAFFFALRILGRDSF